MMVLRALKVFDDIIFSRFYTILESDEKMDRLPGLSFQYRALCSNLLVACERAITPQTDIGSVIPILMSIMSVQDQKVSV